jgi:NADP-dependent 3-hydroxy acid dehydrogenase YdfG
MADAAVSQKAVEVANSRWGRIDSVIINHGSLDPVKKVAESTVEEWRKAYDVNVFSAVGLVCISFFYVVVRCSRRERREREGA